MCVIRNGYKRWVFAMQLSEAWVCVEGGARLFFPYISPNTLYFYSFQPLIRAEWPSGLRRQNQDLVRKGVGSNPTSVTEDILFCPISI